MLLLYFEYNISLLRTQNGARNTHVFFVGCFLLFSVVIVGADDIMWLYYNSARAFILLECARGDVDDDTAQFISMKKFSLFNTDFDFDFDQCIKPFINMRKLTHTHTLDIN